MHQRKVCQGANSQSVLNCVSKVALHSKKVSWAKFVAQLVEQLLSTPEIRGSNPAIGNFIYINCIEKTNIN